MPDGICPFAVQINVKGIDDSVITPGFVDRVGFVDHAAGGFYSTLEQGGFWLRQGVSVHLISARDGRLGQLANIFDTPWAEGRDQDGGSVGPQSRGITWPRFADIGKRNPNGFFISTEHEDWELINGVARAVPGSQWTEAQYATDLRAKRWCIEETKRVTGKDLMRFGKDSLAGHHMFDPVNRAECPGRFWRNEYRDRLFADLTAGAGNPITEDVMQRINSTAPSHRGAVLTAGTQRRIALEDFNPPLPAGARMLRVEVYSAPDGATDPEIQVLDGDGSYAGQTGWGRGGQDSYGFTDVLVQGGGFALRGIGVVAQVGVIGYW